MAAEQGAGKLGCTWRLASEQGTGTLNAGCVPDGCTWRLSSADLGQPREIPFIAAQMGVLVFGSTGTAQLQALAPRAEPRAR